MGSLFPPRSLPSTVRPLPAARRRPPEHRHAPLAVPSSSSHHVRLPPPSSSRGELRLSQTDLARACTPASRRAVLRPRTAPPDADAAAALMVARAEAGDFARAQSIWAQLLLSSAAPCLTAAAPRLLPAYTRVGRYDEVLLAARELSARDPAAARDLYPLAVSCLGAAGELALMEDAVQEMSRVDSATGNAFVRHYAASGTVPEMEAAVGRLKKSGLLISVDAIRAVASAYIAHRKYYKLGEFVRGVGLGRRDAGNLLWNLYLLSFAANFKMKSLQRAFLEMSAAGYRPDLTTFNIRAAAFSKMCMFWDLHLTAEHMRRDGVAPDLVTHGCFVDAYMERRLARNISFAFRRLDGAAEPVVATDGVVFEAFGKGGFHATSEALLEAAGGQRRWTYYDLLGVYLRKQHRRNQIFWNY
ncbi:pentatricopeptide repeat-containing protein At3g42630-like [Triticum dicoccoides]|uniref:pentatricopeptide repeat-containing protein At3g42630-like n=1 Tax=Triticum dicoccoides TaxID=85692 RepID=UPI0018912D8E|nr:pentatricopeptide repeat-containing protein At3g42630-like [Triticum dicoccoides]